MSALVRLPSAVVVWLADAWLRDADANALARSCTAMMQAMQRYRWKERISLKHAVGIQSTPSVSADASSAASVSVGPPRRFGQRVLIPHERDLPLAELPGLLRRLPSTVLDVRFSDDWTAPVESLVLPASVRIVHLGWRLDKPVNAWRLPAALTELTLSNHFNQTLDGVELPSTLRRLSFGGGVFSLFKHSLAALSLPAGLEELRLSAQWNRPLSDLPSLPPSLLVLELGDRFNHPLQTLQQPWPPQLHTLILGSSFNWPLQPVRLPETITELRLGYAWNHSLDGVHLPSALTSLTFGLSFSRSLHRVAWPAGLLSLSLPEDWNQPVAGLLLPPSLTQLNFGSEFCQSLREWDPPPSLTDFALSHAWKGFGAEDLRLPERLTRFHLPAGFKVELADLTLPAGLQSLTLGRETRIADPARVRFPAALRSLDLAKCTLRSLAGFAWPPGLTHLSTGSFQGPLLDWSPPASLTRLDLGDAWVGWTQPVSQLLLPPQLTELRIRVYRAHAMKLSSRSTGDLEDPARCDAPLAGLVLPLSLRRLAVSADWPDPLSGLTLPPQLEAIELQPLNGLRLDGLQLPDSLREFRLIGEFPQSLCSLRLPASLRVLAVLDHVKRAPSDLPLTVPPHLRMVEVGASKVCVMWREWIASCPQVDQRGCVVALHA